MTLSEKRWVRIFTTLILIATSIPYVLGYFLAGENWRFTGFIIGLEDGNSYIAKMLIGSTGEWLFRTPYTAYPQNGFLAFFPYILLGKLAAPPGLHEQLVGLFHVFRCFGAWLMIKATYRFLAYFIKDPSLRKFGTALATVGGGLGWLSFVGGQFLWGDRIPLEFYSPETFGFLSIFSLPHLATGRALLLFGLLCYWKSYEETEHSWRGKIMAGLSWLCLGLMQPLTVLIGYLVLGLDILVRFVLVNSRDVSSAESRQQGLATAITLAGISSPIVIYTAYSFMVDPFLKEWSVQNKIYSPPAGDYLLAFGLMIPFLFLGTREIIHQKEARKLVLVAWIIAFPLLAYFPYSLQRRLPEGIWVAIVIVAMTGLERIHGKLGSAARILACSAFFSTVIFLAGSIFITLKQQAPVYRNIEETQAFDYISRNASQFPVVLSAYDTANALPAWAPVRVLVGHGPESIHLDNLLPRVRAFFSSTTSNEDRLAFIQEFSIQWIIWGPNERALGSWDPNTMTGVQKVFQNENYQVIRLK